MGIQESDSLIHWNYFLSIEEDIKTISRYIEFTTANFDTYSIELARLLLTISSEVDVVSKQLCNLLDDTKIAKNINDYREIIKNHIPNIANEQVTIPHYGLTLKPWENWDSDISPDWWKNHNDVKHSRNDNFMKANLSNVLNAMSGLLLLVLYYYHRKVTDNIINPTPSLFIPPRNIAHIDIVFGGGIGLVFNKE